MNGFIHSDGERFKFRMNWHVYILYSSRYQRSYVGISEDVDRRLTDHNRGYVQSTRPYLPWQLVYVEAMKSREEARAREKYLKSSAGRRWRKKYIKIHMGD